MDRLFPSSQAYDDRTLAAATEKVSKMSANLGGTDIRTPLLQIFAEQTRSGVPRQIFLLTDGEVRNTEECIATVRNNAHTTRVFTFGIGDAASVALCEGMAEAGEGRAEFIRTGTNMQQKVMQQLGRALKPALTDVRVEWPGAGAQAVEQAPYHLPPVFSGGRLLVFGWLGKDAPSGTIVLHASTPKGPQRTEVPLDVARLLPADSKLVQRLAARAAIRDLQEGRSYMHDEKTHALLAKHKPDDLKAQLIALSTASGVLSRHTAFVAVEKRTDATEGDMKLRKIAIEKQQPQAQQQQQQQQAFAYAGGGGGGGARGGGRGGRGGLAPNAAYRMVSQSFHGAGARSHAPTHDAGKMSAAAPTGAFRKYVLRSFAASFSFDSLGSFAQFILLVVGRACPRRPPTEKHRVEEEIKQEQGEQGGQGRRRSRHGDAGGAQAQAGALLITCAPGRGRGGGRRQQRQRQRRRRGRGARGKGLCRPARTRIPC